jgi:putative membrane protein
MVVAFAGNALAQSPASDAPPKRMDSSKTAMRSDSEFANKAAMGGKHEVEGAKMVAGKAANAELKAFANRLVKDHAMANQELTSLMKAKHLMATKEEKPEPELWRNEAGAAFDRAYIEHAVNEHQKDIALFEAEAKDGTDAELKAFANKTLPTLREHLKQAQDLRAKLSTTTSK